MMNSGNRWFAEPDRATTPAEGTAAPGPAPDVGTPLFDELAATYPTTAPAAPEAPSAAAPDVTTGLAPEPRAGSTDTVAPGLAPPAAVLDLFTRIKQIEAGDGSSSAGDTVNVLSLWFAEFGIDIDADEVAAARSLRVPAWLAHALTAPTSEKPGKAWPGHPRTHGQHQPVGQRPPLLAALVQGLGGQTSAAVFDAAGDQIAHFVHPAAD